MPSNASTNEAALLRQAARIRKLLRQMRQSNSVMTRNNINAAKEMENKLKQITKAIKR